VRIDTTGREVLGTPGPATEPRGSFFLYPNRDCGALHLHILRCAAPTHIAVRCTYKYYGALHLQILQCSAPTNITVLCSAERQSRDIFVEPGLINTTRGAEHRNI